MKKHDLQHLFFFTLLIAILILVGRIFLPYFETLALAGALAIFVEPIHRRLSITLGGKPATSAAIVTIGVVLAIALPISLIGFQIFQEARDLYVEITGNRSEYLAHINTLFMNYAQPHLPYLQIDPATILKQSISWVVNHFDDIFTGTITTIVNVFLSLIALFYFLKDGPIFAKALMSYSPLPDRYDRDILHKLRTAVYSVFRGSLLVALIQGTLTGIGFTIFGVPNPSLWGSITAVCALIPGVGTSLVVIPSIVYLFLTGNIIGAIGMTLWGLFAVGLIDNLLAPSLLSKHIQIHPMLILFSVIGGIGLFGPLGFIFGPLTISLLLALLEIYRVIMNRKNERLPF
ncbi:AI-2E family transporter [Candidatus Uhrbacteria bacterium]|nr:AI-2E family transporter [Candidatus Uhrbacteria bacterium]